MFEILIYLFENYFIRKSKIITNKNLIHELAYIGFKKQDIHNSLCWLKSLSYYKKTMFSSFSSLSQSISIRIYTPKEFFKLNSDCRGFILFLEQIKILNGSIREIILEKIMELDLCQLTLEKLKWMV